MTDEQPTRDVPRPISKTGRQKENNRNVINIDENEDTFSNEAQFQRLFERGEKLRH